ATRALTRNHIIKCGLAPASATGSTMRSNYLFTSESVSEAHPDKVADQISDAVVDLFLSRDPVARVACETMVTTNRIVLAGEVRCRDGVTPTIDEIEAAPRATFKRIGYERPGSTCKTADFAFLSPGH